MWQKAFSLRTHPDLQLQALGLHQMLSFKLHFTHRNVCIYVTEETNKSYAVGFGLALTTYPNISLTLRMTLVITLLPILCLHVTLLGDNFIQFMSLGSKGKAVPLQDRSGPEGSRKLRFPDFMTRAQDDGKVVNLTHRPPLPQGNAPGIHFC